MHRTDAHCDQVQGIQKHSYVPKNTLLKTTKQKSTALHSASKPPGHFSCLLVWSFSRHMYPVVLPSKSIKHFNPYFGLFCSSGIQAGNPCSAPFPTPWWCPWYERRAEWIHNRRQQRISSRTNTKHTIQLQTVVSPYTTGSSAFSLP